MEDRELREELEQHEHRVERLIGRIVRPIVDRLDRIEKKIDRTNGRVSLIEKRHIEVDARVQEREKLTAEAGAAAAQQTTALLQEREWSFRKKVGVAGLLVAVISVAVPVVTAILHAVF